MKNLKTSIGVIILGLILGTGVVALSDLISKPFTFSPGTPAVSSQVNANYDTIYNEFNGNITNTNISPLAAIAASKLNLLGAVRNVDISPTAGIVYSKLNLLDSVVDADISSTAAISWSKISKSGSSLAELTTRAILDTTGILTPDRGGLGSDFSAAVEGTIFHVTGTGVVAALAPGSAGDSLRSGGSGEPVSWSHGRKVVIKAAEEIVNASTTLQDDDHLVKAVETSSTYRFELTLLLSSANTTADWKFGWTVPANTTMRWGPEGVVTGTSNVQGYWMPGLTNHTSNDLLAADGEFTAGSSGSALQGMVFKGIITTTDTAGNVQFKWAQNTSNATDSKVLVGSNLILEKLS